MAGARETKTAKSERTRTRILEATARLILERGGRDFQMSEVAALCDMSKGSLYYYFPDRDAIVEEIFVQASDRFADRLEGVVAHSRSAEEAIRSLIEAFCEIVREDGLFVVAMASELHNAGPDVLPELRERFTRITRLAAVQLERAKAEGLVRADLDSDLAAATVCGAVLFGASWDMRERPGSYDAQVMTDCLYHFVLSGIGA